MQAELFRYDNAILCCQLKNQFWGDPRMTEPVVAQTDAEISRCFPVLAELRPHLEATSFVAMVRDIEIQGYRLAFIEDKGDVVAVAGYRIFTSLFMGRNLYVDDLVTKSNSRSRGYGKILIDWLRDVARQSGCHYLHLDSGTQRHRAHRFYLRQGMDIASFHFSEKLDRL
jgi:GNAT superfamily N-acetyltransferase